MQRLLKKWFLVRKLNKEILQAKEKLITPPITKEDGFRVVQQQVVAVRGLFVERAARNRPFKIVEINSILDACVDDGYMRRVVQAGDTTFLVMVTPKGEDFCEPTSFLQTALSQFDRVWLLVVSILSYFAGKYGGKIAEALSKLLGWH